MQMPERKLNKNNRRQSMITWLIVLAIVTTVLAGGVIAKYIKGQEHNNTVLAKEFYFTSNMLTEDCAEYTLNSNIDEISFELGNNKDLLRYAADDVEYTVTVDNGGVLENPDDSTGAATIGGTLEKGAISVETITLKELKKGKTYIVTATGNAGYSKILSAKFKVLDNENNLFKCVNEDNDNYVLLTVWTENLTGTVEICIPQGLIPDNTDPVMSDDDYVDREVIDSGFSSAYSSHTYRFFKETSDVEYKASDFDVKMGTIDATTGTPK